jgi:hypothetical protein
METVERSDQLPYVLATDPGKLNQEWGAERKQMVRRAAYSLISYHISCVMASVFANADAARSSHLISLFDCSSLAC